MPGRVTVRVFGREWVTNAKTAHHGIFDNLYSQTRLSQTCLSRIFQKSEKFSVLVILLQILQLILVQVGVLKSLFLNCIAYRKFYF